MKQIEGIVGINSWFINQQANISISERASGITNPTLKAEAKGYSFPERKTFYMIMVRRYSFKRTLTLRY